MGLRATRMSAQFAVFGVMAMLFSVAMAQTGQSGCATALMTLTPCISYISGGSTTPGSSCCTQLQNVVKTQATCLCQVLNGRASSFGMTINQTQALQLPGACNVQTPPVSQCNGVNQPTGSSKAASPAGSPMSSPADATTPEASVTPDAPTTPTVSSIPSAGKGTKATTGGSTSAGNMATFPLHLSILLLFIASSASAIITM